MRGRRAPRSPAGPAPRGGGGAGPDDRRRGGAAGGGPPGLGRSRRGSSGLLGWLIVTWSIGPRHKNEARRAQKPGKNRARDASSREPAVEPGSGRYESGGDGSSTGKTPPPPGAFAP